MKRRHLSGVPLGGIAGGASTSEVDLSAMDSAIVYIASTSGSTIAIEAAAEPFGEAATWRRLGDSTAVIAAGESVALPASRLYKAASNAYFAGSTISPRRLRIRCVSGNPVTSSWVEGVRSIA